MTSTSANLIGGRYVGRPAMFERYGVPPREALVQGHTVYSWEAQAMQRFETLPPEDYRCQLDAYVLDGNHEVRELERAAGRLRSLHSVKRLNAGSAAPDC